jgi:YidC/Oxa1 family membrane protein insertase
MFDTLIIHPILNLLFVIYSVLPGHDFGVAIIIFTVVIRLALWPLLKKQLHQTRAMRSIQPEIKKIKAQTKGDRQKEGQLLMELYKEKNIKPFGSIGVLVLQLPILFGLFRVLRLLSSDQTAAVDKLYGFVRTMPVVSSIVNDPSLITKALTDSFWGLMDLSKTALSNGTIYWPLLIVALLAGVMQFFQSKQLMPDSGESKSLRDILRGEAKGERAEQKEINAAVGKNMRYFMPVMTAFFAASFPGALALYWASGTGIAIIQQRTILGRDVEEMEELADKKNGNKDKASAKKQNQSGKTPKSKKKKG